MNHIAPPPEQKDRGDGLFAALAISFAVAVIAADAALKPEPVQEACLDKVIVASDTAPACPVPAIQ